MESTIPLIVISVLILSAFIAWLWAKTHTLSSPVNRRVVSVQSNGLREQSLTAMNHVTYRQEKGS